LRLNNVWDDDNVNAMDDALSRIKITGVTCDSRRVKPGYVFAALSGSNVDGRKFIDDAVAAGAAAVIISNDDDGPSLDIPIIRDADPRRRYARACANFYGAQPSNIGAVTGTNGKTSAAWFARQLINAAGFPAASAGTLGVLGTSAAGETVVENSGALTTPDPSDLHHDLKALVDAHVDHLVLEASSHGLDQRRLDGVRVRACAFTNFSRDHLDYHLTEEAYLGAKLRLFDTLTIDGGHAVINTDAHYAEAFMSAAQRRDFKIIRVGSEEDCDFRLISAMPETGGLDIAVCIDGQKQHIALPLVGSFQASNALVALALVSALGVDTSAAIAGMTTLQPAPGRMQLCGKHASGAAVYVDYAHTPDALETVLKSLRPHTSGKLHVVFGCGGDRDPGKRVLMGKAAADFADNVILTDDNPRTEDAVLIRKAALEGAPNAEEISDRRVAIQVAVKGLRTGDILVIAGKGHEQGQTIGDTVHPFNDADEVQAALAGGDA